jgi:hypothetical protein
MEITEFNSQFARRGWVLNNMISVPAARTALAAACAGDWQGADEIWVQILHCTRILHSCPRLSEHVTLPS